MEWLHILLKILGTGYVIYLFASTCTYLLSYLIRTKKAGRIVAAPLAIAIYFLIFVVPDLPSIQWVVVVPGIILGMVQFYFTFPSHPKINRRIDNRYASRS